MVRKALEFFGIVEAGAAPRAAAPRAAAPRAESYRPAVRFDTAQTSLRAGKPNHDNGVAKLFEVELQDQFGNVTLATQAINVVMSSSRTVLESCTAWPMEAETGARMAGCGTALPQAEAVTDLWRNSSRL